MAKVLSGREVANAMESSLRRRAGECASRGVRPTLAIVRVGEQPSDLSYERGISKRADRIGVDVRHIELPEDVSQERLIGVLDRINADESAHGCLMFRPLPAHLDEDEACDAIEPAKDVDAVSTVSLGRVFFGDENGFAPSTAAACMKIIDHFGIEVTGKHVVVVGRSMVVGKPVAMLLLSRNATVSICHSMTENLVEMVRSADLVICATGRAKMFGAEYFRSGQVVLDVGIDFDDEGRLCGDVDYAAVEPIVDAITPVPGGVGSVTSSVTLEHVVSAAEDIVRR